MIWPSVPLRQALVKLTLPVLFVVSFGVVLLGRLDFMVAERARIALADALAPVYATLAGPLDDVRAGVAQITGLIALNADNARLQAENTRLRHWQAVALTLAARNRALQAALHWVPSPAPKFVTARVVADAGGVYARAVLLATGPNHFVRKGQIALADGSLVGRVTDVGSRSARVLLLTDRNSRVPVMLEGSHTRAILIGTNGARPRLVFWSDAAPREGEQVVTAGVAGAFPPDLPVGTVRYTSAHIPEVVPDAELGRLDMVEIVAGGSSGVPAPDAAGAQATDATAQAPAAITPASPPALWAPPATAPTATAAITVTPATATPTATAPITAKSITGT
ncbi:MAG: rod shape-determining protein MreC, partial [Acetobacteraceae bacterium]